MKKFTLLVAMIATALAVKAQDLIVMRNADEIQAKVLEISPKSVTYKRWINLDGPTYTISKSEVFYIKYQNGEKDIMSEMTAAPAPPTASSASAAHVVPKRSSASAAPVTVAPAKPKKNAKPNISVRFSAYAMLGAEFGKYSINNIFPAGPTLDVSVGAKISEYFYIGIETGFRSMICTYYHHHDEQTVSELFAYVPIGVNMKGYFTKGKKVNPYLNCSLGGFIGVGGMLADYNGFSCQVGAGIEFGRFSFGIGYSGMKYDDLTQNNGYVKLGVRFGK